MYALATFLLMCVDVSSVYEVSCSGAGGMYMSDVYMFKRGTSFKLTLC